MSSGLIDLEHRAGLLSGSMVLSVLLHLIGGMLLLWISASGSQSHSSTAMSREMLVEPIEQDDPLTLGLNDAQSASINWLGIERQESVDGDAIISETEQAAQTPVVGAGAEPIAPEQEVVEEQAEQPAEQAIEQHQEEFPEQAEIIEESPTQEMDQLVIEQDEGIEVVVAEEVLEESAPDVSPEPSNASELAQSTSKETQEQPKQPAPAGDVGVLSEREVIATRIKKAIEIDPRKPNAPIAGKGLEITTVRPRYSTETRLSAVPRNPIVVIRFGADGKVRKAEFLWDGKRRLTSGDSRVDQPLLNAIYRWKAKGTQVDALNPNDINDTVEVTIKIIYQRERKVYSD